MTFIGIDPGLKGAIAFYDPMPGEVTFSLAPGSLNYAYLLSLHNMPTRKLANGKREVDGATVAFLVDNFVNGEAVAIVEDVASRPGQGVVSMFTFGKGFGVVLGVLEAKGIKIILTKPQVWKSLLGLDSDKSKSIARAVFTFPAHAAYFGRLDDGKAEAALLAKLGETRLCAKQNPTANSL